LREQGQFFQFLLRIKTAAIVATRRADAGITAFPSTQGFGGEPRVSVVMALIEYINLRCRWMN